MRYSLHHLWYFWNVARTGSITQAAQHLHVSQSTICGIIKQLEESLDAPLFRRQGRSLVLTEQGRLAQSYADEIFALGQELDARFGGAVLGGRQHLRVGVEDVLPDLMVHRLLEPVIGPQVRLDCQDDSAAKLVADLALQRYDVILVDHPVTPDHHIRISNHQLGESGTTIVATPAVAARLTGKFPRNLSGQPFIMPSAGSLFARQLAQWFTAERVAPDIAADIGDSDLMAVLASADGGCCAVPSVIESQACARHGLQVIGRTDQVCIRVYAVTTERRQRHLWVKALLDNAKQLLT